MAVYPVKRHTRIGSTMFLSDSWPHIFKGDIDLAAEFPPLRVVGDASTPAGLAIPLQTGGDVNSVAPQIAVRSRTITSPRWMPTRVLDAFLRYEIRIANRHRALDIDGRAHCVHHACKLDKNAISGRVGDMPAIPADIVGSINSDRSARMCASVPSSSAPVSREIAGDIQCEKRGELPGFSWS